MKRNLIFMISLMLILILSACGGLGSPTPSSATSANSSPFPTAGPTPTPQPLAPATVTVDTNGVAQSSTSETVAAVALSPTVVPYDVMPQYTRLTLQGYPVTTHTRKPEISVFPVQDLFVNYSAEPVPAQLMSLLQSQKPGNSLPFLPVYNQVQMLHAQVKFLDFKSGKGVRYLTQYAQGLVPVNNQDLFYTFQGLTSDNKYYVSVVMPVTLTGTLPANVNDTANLPQEFQTNYTSYLTSITNLLNQQADSAFTPDLSKLDTMVQSIDVK